MQADGRSEAMFWRTLCGEFQTLVLCRSINVIDHQNLDSGFGSYELQAELLLHGGKEAGNRVRFVGGCASGIFFEAIAQREVVLAGQPRVVYQGALEEKG